MRCGGSCSSPPLFGGELRAKCLRGACPSAGGAEGQAGRAGGGVAAPPNAALMGQACPQDRLGRVREGASADVPSRIRPDVLQVRPAGAGAPACILSRGSLSVADFVLRREGGGH
eukprot:6084179-Alexandrium_andersonii.AAC.1